MPATGNISGSITYTLTDDCTQTGRLTINTPPAGESGYALTIDGDGHTVKLGSGTYQFVLSADSRNTLTLRDVTIDGQLHERPGIIQSEIVNAERVSFVRNYGTVISSASVTLTNVLFDSNRFSGLHFAANGGTLNLPSGSATITDAVFRSNRTMNIKTHGSATLTTAGCLTFSGNSAYNVVHSGVYSSAGTWTDNTNGKNCDDKEEIGNGGKPTMSAPARLGCGFHASTNFDRDLSYNLRGDCSISGDYNLTEGVTVRINGFGRRLIGDATNRARFFIAAGASLIVDNVHSENIEYTNFGTMRGNRFHAKDLNGTTVIDNHGAAAFTNSIFSDNIGRWSGAVLIASNYFNSGVTSFTNVIFRDNKSTSGRPGGGAAIRQIGGASSTASITLNGCITFENNTNAADQVADTLGVIIDNSTGACGDTDTIGPGPPTIPPTGNGPTNSAPSDNSDQGGSDRQTRSATCFQALGAIGLVCRGKDGAEPFLEVWEISPESVGSFALGIRQRQVEAAGAGLTLCSANERARIRVGPLPPEEALEIWRWDPRYPEEINRPRTYITVSMGPSFEGKVHHVILDHTLEGRVLSTVDTFGRLQDCAEMQPAPPQRHVLRDCMATTKAILNFRANPAGEIMDVLPYNVTLTVLERTDSWFKVDFHGERGWISADYVATAGNCG